MQTKKMPSKNIITLNECSSKLETYADKARYSLKSCAKVVLDMPYYKLRIFESSFLQDFI